VVEEKQCVPFLALFVLCGWLFFSLHLTGRGYAEFEKNSVAIFF